MSELNSDSFKNNVLGAYIIKAGGPKTGKTGEGRLSIHLHKVALL